MRVNIYEEERTNEIEIVETTAKTGKKYPGVRFILHSSERLHIKEDDDDRSAVTFWFHDKKQMEHFFIYVKNEIERMK